MNDSNCSNCSCEDITIATPTPAPVDAVPGQVFSVLLSIAVIIETVCIVILVARLKGIKV